MILFIRPPPQAEIKDIDLLNPPNPSRPASGDQDAS